MDLISSMKDRIKNSGVSRKEVFYVAADSKRRIRFLQELDTGHEFKFHNHWNRGVNALCAEQYGEDCPYCSDTDEEMKEYVAYAWNVWDYDANAVRILLYKATGITPVPAFIEFFDEYGTICDRDYTIKKIGKGMSGNITVIPGEISKFRNSKAKCYNEKQMIKLLKEAYPINSEDANDISDDDEDEKSVKKLRRENKPKQTGKKKVKKEPTIEDRLNELDIDDLREVAINLGITKKELKGKDTDDIVEVILDDYDEDDIKEILDDLDSDDEDEGDWDEDEEDDE